MKKTLLFIFTFCSLLSIAQTQRSNLRAGQAPFFHGVASGDPLSDAVMIWTRVTPPTGDTSDVLVNWQIATDLNFSNVVNFGKTTATQASDFTVKIDVCGLNPGTHYYFVFRAFDTNSIIGRTKTAPIGSVAQARFAVASCSSYEHGFFNAYESMSKRNDLDAIIHLGDYIYEYASGGFSSTVVTDMGRTYQPTTEIITLDDYRIRHSHYKLDDQLQRLHQVHPFVTTWDDHETANDSYKDGAQNHDPGTEGPWTTRKISGTQAYKEWMPIRNPDPLNDTKIWRSLRYGNLLDLIVLDSRLWARDLQDLGATNSTNRDLLGDDQFMWLEQQLSDNTTQWKVICQQVMMAPLELLGFAVNADQWDGYNKDRNRLINYIENNNVANPVVLTGDIHTSWVNNVPGNSLTSAAVEFVVTSVTSPGLDVIETALGQIPQALLDLFGGAVTGVVQSFNPHMEYVNVEDHGYMVLTVNTTRAQGDYIWLERESIDTTDSAGPSYYTSSGSSNMTSANAPIVNGTGPMFPPPVAIQTLPFAMIPDTFVAMNTENNFYNNCLVTILNACPSITTSIIEAPEYGVATVSDFCFDYNPIANYYGMDYFTVVVCQTAQPADCDTVVVAMETLPDNDIEVYTYYIANDSVLEDCLTMNDLVGPEEDFSFLYTGGLSFEIDSQGCFKYQPDGMFSGVELAYLITCDSLGFCDTIQLEFIVSGTSQIQVVNLTVEQGALLSYCLGFDEIQGNIVSSNIEFDPANGNALTFNDTCISYISDDDFEGVDTLMFYACDDYVPQICDTTVYIITVTPADTTPVDTTGVIDVQNDQFAVMGVYPNPFDVEVLIQYYQFKDEPISIALYDMLGRVIYKELINDSSEGLKYARLETSQMARGNYILELSTRDFQYTKHIQKH